MRHLRGKEVFLLYLPVTVGGVVASLAVPGMLAIQDSGLGDFLGIFGITLSLFLLIGYPLVYMLVRYELVRWHIFSLTGLFVGPIVVILVFGSGVGMNIVFCSAIASALGAAVVFLSYIGLNRKLY